MALLFLLVYAGAIAVLVLFVVMMLDVKAIENPWSARKKRLLYIGALTFVCLLFIISSNDRFLGFFKLLCITCISYLVAFSGLSYEEDIKYFFRSIITDEAKVEYLKYPQEQGKSDTSIKTAKKTFNEFFEERTGMTLSDSENWTSFLNILSHNEAVEESYGANTVWFVEFDPSLGVSDLSYLLYSTHAVLLVIGGVILLIAMVGAISLTLQKNCPESLYRQLGRESRNAIFSVKEKSLAKSLISGHRDVLHQK